LGGRDRLLIEALYSAVDDLMKPELTNSLSFPCEFDLLLAGHKLFKGILKGKHVILK